jgi:hypothetical protein
MHIVPIARGTYRYDKRGNQQVIRQGNRQLVVHYEKPQRKSHWLVPAGIGVIVTLVILCLLSAIANWLNNWQTDTKYGYPRIWQTDAVVGHYDSEQNPSHFIFENLHGHILIIEISGGDPAHSHIYSGPTLLGGNGDNFPVTGEFIEENGRSDMIAHVDNQRIVYVNDGIQFKQQQ